MKLSECKIGTLVKKDYARCLPCGNGDRLGKIVGVPIKYSTCYRVPVLWDGKDTPVEEAYQRLYIIQPDGWAKGAVLPSTARRL